MVNQAYVATDASAITVIAPNFSRTGANLKYEILANNAITISFSGILIQNDLDSTIVADGGTVIVIELECLTTFWGLKTFRTYTIT